MQIQVTTMLSCLLVGASALHIAPSRALPVRMQIAVPDAPVVIPDTFKVPGDALPTTWEVPDTFSLPSMKKKSEEPPFFRITLFKSTNFDAVYAAQSLIKVIGLEDMRAKEIASQAKTMGFAVVGEWVQEVAETYGEGLQARQLTVDVSEV